MKHSPIFPALAASVSLSACQPGASTPLVQVIAGPAGATGTQGDAGEKGDKGGSGDTVVVLPQR